MDTKNSLRQIFAVYNYMPDIIGICFRTQLFRTYCLVVAASSAYF